MSLTYFVWRRFSGMRFDHSRIESNADVICVCVLVLSAVCSVLFFCSRFVCESRKSACSHAMRSTLIKELLQHMGRDISSYACQTDWILSFFISINNKQRQDRIQRASSEKREMKWEEMLCIRILLDTSTYCSMTFIIEDSIV